MNDVQAMPVAPKAKPTRRAAGSARTPQGDRNSPMTSITRQNAAAYTPARTSAQPISPLAMSTGASGVASIASYNLAYLNLKKTLRVVSYTTPFIAELANMAGA